MGLNFRKSITILPGVKLNLSKSGVSASFGTKGIRQSISTTGRARTTLGIPGTGVYYTKQTNVKKLAGGLKDKITGKKTDSKKDRKEEKKTSSKAKKTIIGAAAGAVVTSVTRSIGNEISKSLTGQKKSSTKDIAGKAISAGATTALRQITRSILGNLIK